jgi:hypothetical protein
MKLIAMGGIIPSVIGMFAAVGVFGENPWFTAPVILCVVVAYATDFNLWLRYRREAM